MEFCSNSIPSDFPSRQPLVRTSESSVSISSSISSAPSLSPISPTSVCGSDVGGSPHDASSSPFFTVHNNNHNNDEHQPFLKAKRRGSGRSISSSMTDWSTSTAPASNTTIAQEEKKKHKSRFVKFANVLLKFLERKDPTVYAEAQAVIRDCEEQKRLGHVESFSESVKAPLKDLVGPSYWKQAWRYSKKMQQQQQHHNQYEEFEPLSMTEDPPTFSQDEVACLEKCLNVRQQQQQQQQQQERRSSSSWMFPLTTKSCKTLGEELKLRRDRFWMLIRVLMKYLEKTDPAMFLQARQIIEENMRRNNNQSTTTTNKRRQRRKKHDYQTLTQNIQIEIKQLVGVNRWRRAEAYLAKILIKRADEEAAAPFSSTDYDLEITDDGLKSFGGPGYRSWEEDARPRSSTKPSPRLLAQRTTSPEEVFAPRREPSSRPVGSKRARSGEKDRRAASFTSRASSLALGGRLWGVATMDPKRRRVHSLD